MGALLEVQHLKKFYPTARGVLHAVDDVSFSLEGGKTLGVVGESGCGKSTLGKTILRLEDPTSGSIQFEGKEIGGLSTGEFKHYRKEMQMISRTPSLR